MVDTSWDRPGVDPESFFDAPEEQVASREQSPTTSSKIQSSGWENSELGKVMQSLSERPALVGRVKWLIACFDRVLLDDSHYASRHLAAERQRHGRVPIALAGCQPLAGLRGGSLRVRDAESGGSAAPQMGRGAAADAMSSQTTAKHHQQ